MKEIVRNPDTFHKILVMTVTCADYKELLAQAFDELLDLFG